MEQPILLTATDMYNGNKHYYPAKESDLPLLVKRYDFIFTKNESWYYTSSSDHPTEFKSLKLHEPVEDVGEQWMIINNLTGAIHETNITNKTYTSQE